MEDNDEKQCCPEFDPKTLDEKTHVWKDKPFIEDDVMQIMHIPLNMGKVITRMWKKVDEAKAAPPNKEFLILAYDPSPWKSELYMTVTKEVPDAKNVKISGTFMSKVFDGPYNAVPKYIKEMEAYVSSQGKTILKHYFHYTYCPKCSKKYGHNYCVDFAQVE